MNSVSDFPKFDFLDNASLKTFVLTYIHTLLTFPNTENLFVISILTIYVFTSVLKEKYDTMKLNFDLQTNYEMLFIENDHELVMFLIRDFNIFVSKLY